MHVNQTEFIYIVLNVKPFLTTVELRSHIYLVLNYELKDKF